ncbi:hepatic lectin-like isoform X2 [Rhineura floridana]|uniref:hepatic lectin-like isoform X2 n=1 Tax=Rhineura floridana TaxID=261503 RepID=UPI002AC84F79|nr:hepatic lectin-like isoform X2 [Rhineura floridana]
MGKKIRISATSLSNIQWCLNESNRSFPQRKWRSPFLVYLLLAFAYLLIIILFGLLLYNGSRLSSEVSKLLKQVKMKESFPCGSRSREWEYFDGECYHFSVQRATWHTAKSHCEERNSSLVVVNDEAEQNFLESQARTENFWIGLTDADNEGEWRWIDGTNYRNGYKKWKKGEPNNHDHKEDCAHLSGEWNDLACNASMFYVCEKPLPS